ncbi:MAG: TylF/MycF/NovP-related O-methyltransferase [Candidatus Odinarchaeota archaeon]
MMKNAIKRILPPRIIDAIRVLRYSNVGVMVNPAYNADGIITYHVANFLNDKSYINAYRTAMKKTGQKLHYWSIHTALWAAKRGVSLEGDFVECGVDVGFSSLAIANYLDFNKIGKNFYLLDTYEGIPVEYVSKEEFAINDPRNRNYQNTYEQVKQTFKEYKNIHIIKGKVPDTLEQVKAEKVAYLSLDMNNAYPEIAAANYFWDKLVSGAMILLDDYCFHEKYRIQREAFDEFAKERDISILALPTGQGLIVKP